MTNEHKNGMFQATMSIVMRLAYTGKIAQAEMALVAAAETKTCTEVQLNQIAKDAGLYLKWSETRHEINWS